MDNLSAYIVSLLHFEDKNNPYKDECDNIWLSLGNPQISLTNKKIGSGSLYLSDSSYLKMSNSILLGADSFTIDGWAYAQSDKLNYREKLFEVINDSSYLFSVYMYNYGAFWDFNGLNVDLYSYKCFLNEWFYFAVKYNHRNSNIQFCINENTVYNFKYNFKNRTACKILIGYSSLSVHSGAYWNGYFDEFRVLNGIVL